MLSFIKVKELGTVSITTDKEQYAAKEILQAESKIALIGNQIKRYADWDLKDLNNIVLDADSSRLKLTSTSDSEWRNLVLNGDFELGDKDKSWVLSSRFYITQDNYLNFSGKWSLAPIVYYGSFCAYQRIKIPMNAEAIELSSKECIHFYDGDDCLYKICIADINGIPYRRLYESKIGDKSIVSHHYELDPKEWAGKTVDLQFHMNGSFTEGAIDDVDDPSVKISFNQYSQKPLPMHLLSHVRSWSAGMKICMVAD